MINDAPLSSAVWRKSSHSGGGQQCVEFADLGAVTAVRDSKNPDGPVLQFPRSAMTAFLTAVKTGRFDC